MSFGLVVRTPAYSELAIKKSLKIVRKVIAEHAQPSGLTTTEIFKLAVKEGGLPEAASEPVVTSPSIKSRGTKKGVKEVAPRAFVHPDHPIRSVRFLKKSVLPILEGQKELEMVCTKRLVQPPTAAPSVARSGGAQQRKKQAPVAESKEPTPVTVWAWKVVEKDPNAKEPGPIVWRRPFGVEVGVGADWSHLNKRRQRTRIDKVREDANQMRQLRGTSRAQEMQKLRAQFGANARIKTLIE